jgi:hypothetical protein
MNAIGHNSAETAGKSEILLEIKSNGLRGAESEIGARNQVIFTRELAANRGGVESSRLPVGKEIVLLLEDPFGAKEDIHLCDYLEAAPP